MPTIADLLEIKQPSYKRTFANFEKVFGISISDYFIGEHFGFVGKQKIDNVIFDYFKTNKAFLDDFYNDWLSVRTIKGIAQQNNFDYEQVLELFKSRKIFANYNYLGRILRDDTIQYVSTYQVIELITGKQVIERPPVCREIHDLLWSHDHPFEDLHVVTEEKLKASMAKLKPRINILGYEDIRTHITEELEVVANPSEINKWGLSNPGGILFYGPPGCGKTMWAKWVAEYLNYNFVEIPRSTFGSMFVDGAMNNLKALLKDLKDKKNTVVFFDEFDSVAPARNEGTSSSGTENAKVINTLLQEIPNLINNKIVVIAATNFIESLDPAVIRPGRFDMKLPIFPPLPDERIVLLHRATLSDDKLSLLDTNSTLTLIMRYNHLTELENWWQFKEHLELFSNSQILDAAKIIKKKLRRLHEQNGDSTQFSLPDDFILNCIKEARSKITARDAMLLKRFLNECIESKHDIFQDRVSALESELNNYFGVKTRQLIGFR